MAEKQCYHCGDVKQLDEFTRDKNIRGGFGSRCLECKRKFDRDRQHTPRVVEQQRLSSARYYASDRGRAQRATERGAV